MAKHIKFGVGPGGLSPAYVPSENIMKVVADHTANTCVFTYIGGGTVTGAITLADAAAARALEASINASWLSCIDDGPDAAGVVVNTTGFTSVS